ncbi:MAG: metallophosphoesterase [Parcubacteria group bacterium]|jgi:3',5'-cyclic AMP phosphodiesterase CpdA
MKKLIILLILIPSLCSAATVGVVTDLHVGKKNMKQSKTACSPEEKISYFEDALRNFEDKADAVIVDGDMTDKGLKTYAKMLKDAADKFSSVKTIWVKGNHDKKSFKVFNGSTYYYCDLKKIRIIVLDTNERNSDSTGGLKKTQLKFLKQALQTDKDVIIAMHHPPFSRTSKKYSNKYKEFRKLLTPNVKYVLSGHWESSWKTEIGGVKYRVIPALTKKGACTLISISQD